MKRVVVTGATGMIGIALIQVLLEKKIEKIYAVVRSGCKNLSRLPKSSAVEIIECDINLYEKLPSQIQEPCDVFYHFAWQATGRTEIRNQQILQQAENIEYTIKALKAAKELKCKKFIGAGSQAEYGILDEEKISPISPTNPMQPYGIAKYAAGKLIEAQGKLWGISSIWVRIFSVYGRYDQETTMVSSTIERLKKKERPSFTPAKQRWDYLYAEDAGWAFYLIGEKVSGNRVYCLGSGNARPLHEYIEEIRDVIDPKLEVGIGDVPYPPQAVMNLCADIEELTKDTGWKPKVSFQEGIIKCCDFVKCKRELDTNVQL